MLSMCTQPHDTLQKPFCQMQKWGASSPPRADRREDVPVLHLLHLVTWPHVPLKGFRLAVTKAGHTFVQLGPRHSSSHQRGGDHQDWDLLTRLPSCLLIQTEAAEDTGQTLLRKHFIMI